MLHRRPADANLGPNVDSLVAWHKEEEEPVDNVRLQGTAKEPERPKRQRSGVCGDTGDQADTDPIRG